jgi:hypothetical protein
LNVVLIWGCPIWNGAIYSSLFEFRIDSHSSPAPADPIEKHVLFSWNILTSISVLVYIIFINFDNDEMTDFIKLIKCKTTEINNNFKIDKKLYIWDSLKFKLKFKKIRWADTNPTIFTFIFVIIFSSFLFKAKASTVIDNIFAFFIWMRWKS